MKHVVMSVLQQEMRDNMSSVKTFKPKSEADLASMILGGDNFEIIGGGTRAIGKLDTPPRNLIDMTGMSGIIDYEPAEMVMIAKAGTPSADIEKALKKGGQRMVFEPLDYRPLLGTKGNPTIGGAIAANASGPRRFVAGACRDSFLGARFVNGKGDIIKAGGRVMKNVTGLDLIKLLAGSWGTIAPMSEVTFKVVPQVETEATLVLHGLSDLDAAKAMASAMATPCEVTGAAHLPQNIAEQFKEFDGKSATLLRLEGFEKSVNLRIEKLQAIFSEYSEQHVLNDKQTKSVWASLRDVTPFSDGTQEPVWKISVAPMAGHQLVAEFGPADAYYDWQGGLVWLRLDGDPHVDKVRAAVKKVGGGHATLVRASNEHRRSVSVFQPENPAVAEISKRIRKQFDPLGKFYTGRMG